MLPGRTCLAQVAEGRGASAARLFVVPMPLASTAAFWAAPALSFFGFLDELLERGNRHADFSTSSHAARLRGATFARQERRRLRFHTRQWTSH
jgi:hypothetical protein